MSGRSRVLGYGAAALVVIAGVVLVAVGSSTAVQAVGGALMGLGLVAITSLVFYEVGLSEDRERAREEAARERARRPPQDPHPQPRLSPPRRRRRL